MKKVKITQLLIILFLSGISAIVYSQNAVGIQNRTSRTQFISIEDIFNYNSPVPVSKNNPNQLVQNEGQIKINKNNPLFSNEKKGLFPSAKDVLLDEGFEEWPPENWNFFELGVTSVGWQQSNFQPHTGTYSALHGYFSGGVHDNWMVTPQLTIDQTYNLEFWDKLTSYNYYEYSGVLISTNSGDPSSGDFVEIYNAGSATANVWVEHVFDLTPYIGEDIYIAFQYSGNNAHRWYVDDVTVIPLTYADGGITAITNPPVGTTTVGGSIEDVMVVLENFGTEIIEDAEIEWMVNSISQTTFFTSSLSLNPGESVELNIGQYDFSQYTTYDITVTANITGDQNSANDSYTGTYTVDDLGDAGITGISPNGQSGPAFEQDVKVTIHNYGTHVLESVEIEWEVNDVPQIPFIASNLGLATGSSTEQTIGQYDFSIPDYYQILAATNLPADYVPANDTMSVLFSSGMLRESFEGPHNKFWPPDHWEMKYASYPQDWPYHGDYMGLVLSGANEWGSSDGWLTTPLLDISPGDLFNFQMRTDGLTGGGFSINWQDGQTGEIHLIQNVSTANPFEWFENNIDISAASGINRIVLKVSSTTYNDAYLDLIKCTAPVYTFDNDLEVLRFDHNWTPFTNIQDTISCTVRNYTAFNLAAGTYTVKLMEESGIELQSITGSEINAMEEIIYEFYHTFTDEDQHNLYVQVEYSNDQNPADNISNIASIYPVPPPTQSIVIGEAEIGNLNIPFDTFGTEGLGQDDFSQMIYHADEVGTMGYIYGFTFHYNLYSLMYGQVLPLTVWIGETLNDDLSGGWEPYENMTLVFDSLVITKNYLYEMFIPFDEPYLYTGGNIVIQTIQHDPEFMASWTSFHCTETPGELRTAKSPDWYEIDPENPPSFENETQYWEQLPDATFILNPFDDLSEVSGTIYNENNEPVEDVLVELVGTALKTFTNDLGNYSFPTIPFGDWIIKASYLGYEDNYQDITVDETIVILDFALIPKPLITVIGYVEGTEEPGAPLEEVSIEITGYAEFEGVTNTVGIFNIDNVFGNADYNVEISKFGYEPYFTTISLTDQNIDLGTIILQQRVISTFNVSAQENPDDYIAEVYWHDPLSGMEDTLQYDWGVESYGLANDPMENVWLGNFMPNSDIITITSVTVFFINNPQTSGEVSLDIFDANENLLVSSENFFTQNQSYLTIDFPNLTYDGDLFIMLHWKDNPTTTNMLGIDFSIGIPDYCYIRYPGEGFQLLSDFLGTSPAVALIRANVLKATEDNKALESKAVQSYNIYRGESYDLYNIGNWTQVNTEPVTELEYIDETWLNVGPNDYRYAIEAVYVEGNAEVTYSGILSIDFIAPSNLEIDSDPISGETLFTWDSPEHSVQSYDVYLDDMNEPIGNNITELEYIFTDIGPGLHEAGVQANYNTGQSIIETTPFTIVGINESETEPIRIFPNPSRDYIKVEHAKGYELIIHDMSGKVVLKQSCENIIQQLDVSELNTGIYIIKLVGEDNVINKKLEIHK